MKLYRHHEAQKWLKIFVVFSLVLLCTLLLVFYAVEQQWLQQKIRLGTQLFAVSQTNGNVREFFNGMPLSFDAQVLSEQLQAEHFIPKTILKSEPTWLLLTLGIWGGVSAVFFGLMTLFFKNMYQELEEVKLYVTKLMSNEAVYDIRSNKEGVVSSLRNELYQTATALHHQFKTVQKHKDYLAKNIADISHQLKTPLTSLLVVNDTLLALPIEERTDDKLHLLEPQLERIETLIQSLLILTRLDAGVLTLKKEPCQVANVLADILTQLAVLIDKKGIVLEQQIDENITLLVDRFYISETISNVLKNAIDHTPQGHKITIQASDTIFFTTLHIKNEGEKISKEDLPYIFDRFYKGKRSLSSGVGIGLSLAKEITQAHQGNLMAENVSDGVLFTLSIPKE